MYCKLFPTLDRNTLILTANSRLSRHLQQAYSHYQHLNGRLAFETANIIPLSVWLIQQWQHNTFATGKLLSENEEKVLWQSIIKSDKKSAALLQPKNTALLAKQAWEILTHWQLKPEELNEENLEISKFIEWSKKFQSNKEAKQYYSQAELPKELNQLLNAGQLTLPKSIVLVGFDDFSPALKNLFSNMEKRTQLSEFTGRIENNEQSQVQAKERDNEIASMAAWAKKMLPSLKPNEQIACIVPSLNTLRPQLVRLFTEEFAPENYQPPYPNKTLPVNISAGIALSKIPLIQTALNILKLVFRPLKKETLSQVLLSPYVNSTIDDQGLAAILASQLTTHSTHEKIITFLKQEEKNYQESTFAKRWQALFETKIETQRQNYSQWRVILETRLAKIGWPGLRTLNSDEHQALTRWHEVLEEYSNFDSLLTPATHSEAYTLLVELCQNSLFQAQTNDAAIQVLGLLEASGSYFKYSWVMGLNEKEWPPKASPNPFLPLNLQRTRNMPHASALREYTYCQQIQAKLFSSADTVIASYASSDEQRELLPSPLIRSLKKIPIEQLITLSDPVKISEKLEAVIDDFGPPIKEEETVLGGSRIFQLQAICPFQAFSALRLRAQPLDVEEIGLNAKERGIAVHAALDFIWRDLHHHQQLLETSPTALIHLVQEAVNKVCPQQSFYWDVERKRLQSLLEAWLDREKQRPPFAVLQRESKRSIQIGPIKLTIQIDRIDTLENGQHLIIDYKTGTGLSSASWFGERIEQPQLPIYALYGCEKSCGLAYAEVNLKSLTFKGIIDDEKGFAKILPLQKVLDTPTDWETQQQHWQCALEEIAVEFNKGVACVNPLNEKACQYCEYKPLCRIGEDQ